MVVDSSSARLNLSSAAVVEDMDHPFAEGAFRWVAGGKYTNGPRNGERCVHKWFKTGAVYDDVFYEKDILAVQKAKEIIDAFNAGGFITQTIQINMPAVWVVKEGSPHAGQKLLVEPFIENFQKFNTNSGVRFGTEDGWPGLMQALSHFSYHTTGGRYVLCDLQGGILKDGTGAILTDPVILSRDREYGITDLGEEGISTFFARHQCNKYCRDHWQKPRNRQVYFKANEGTTMLGLQANNGK